MKALRFAGLWVLALALPGLHVAHAGKITGQFVIGGKTVPVHEVAAFRMRDQFNPRTFETYVMLTAKPVDRAAIGAALDPYAVAINDPAVHDADYIAFSVQRRRQDQRQRSRGRYPVPRQLGHDHGPARLAGRDLPREYGDAHRLQREDGEPREVDGWADLVDGPDLRVRRAGPRAGQAAGERRRGSRQGVAGPAGRGRRQRSGEDPGAPDTRGGQELPGGLALAGGESRLGEGHSGCPAAEKAQDHRRRAGGGRPRGARGRRRAVRERPHALPRRDAAGRRTLALRVSSGVAGMLRDEAKGKPR